MCHVLYFSVSVSVCLSLSLSACLCLSRSIIHSLSLFHSLIPSLSLSPPPVFVVVHKQLLSGYSRTLHRWTEATPLPYPHRAKYNPTKNTFSKYQCVSIGQAWKKCCTKNNMAEFREECWESTGELSVRNARRLSSVPLQPSKWKHLRTV